MTVSMSVHKLVSDNVSQDRSLTSVLDLLFFCLSCEWAQHHYVFRVFYPSVCMRVRMCTYLPTQAESSSDWLGLLLISGFYPCDAVLASVLAMALCLSVCLSVTSRSSINTDERIELAFGMGASVHPSYTVLWGKVSVRLCLHHDSVTRHRSISNS